MAKKNKKQQAKELENTGLSQPQGFTHGMISDLDPHFQLKGSYSDAKNIRLTNAEGDTFTVENIEGNSLFVDLATFPISVNAGQGGETGSNNYATFYDRGPESVFLKNNLNLDNRASIVGHVSYANQMLLMIVGRFEYAKKWDNGTSSTIEETADRTIFLMVDFDKAFKVSKVSDLRVCYHEGASIGRPAVEYPDLGMDLDNPVRIEHIIENDCISRIYWTDNKNPLRTLNVKQERLDLLSRESLDMTPLMDPSQPFLYQTLHGSLPVGIYQYTYKYISENGGESTFSPLSNVYHVSDQSFGSSVTYGGGPKGNLGTQGFTIKVSDIDEDFEYVELYTLFYEELNQPPRVALVGRSLINGINDVTFQHTTWNNEIENGLEEVLIESNTWDVCKDIAIKDNILFAANLKQKKNWISEKEWNVKVLRWVISEGAAGASARYLSAMLTTNDSEVKHYQDTGSGAIEITNGTQDDNNDWCGYGQILGSAHSSNNPSAYPSSSHDYLNYDGNLNNPMWTTAYNQRHGHGGTDGRVKYKFEYRYLSDRMTLGGESFNYATNGLGGARVTFGVREREADQTQNTSTSPYISASTSGEEFQTDNIHDFSGQGDGSPPHTDTDNTGTKFRTSMSLGGTKDPHAAGNKRGYQRGDVYRFGVQTYDLTGAPGNVLWIGDIQTPEQHDVLRMVDVHQSTYSPFRSSFHSFTNVNGDTTIGLVDAENIVSHDHVRDHRLSYVYGHAVAPVDVEWFSARLTGGNNSLQNLDAYVKSDGSFFNAKFLPNNGGDFLNEGRRKGVTRHGANLYSKDNSPGDRDNHTNTHYLYDLYVNFEFLIPDEVVKKISGFRVVRAVRGEEDRRIIQQGLLNQTIQYGNANEGLEAGYGNTKFSRDDNEAFDDDPVFVNQFNDPDDGAEATKVEQPEYNTYLNGYLGLAENSNLAFYLSTGTDGKVTAGGNTDGYISSRTEREDPKGFGNRAGYANPLTDINGNAHPKAFVGPGCMTTLKKHSSYFGSYDKRVTFGSGGIPAKRPQSRLDVSGSIYTLDSPDSAFGIRPYVYREGDSLRIDCVMKLTHDIRYKNHDVTSGNTTNPWGVGWPAWNFLHCAPSDNYVAGGGSDGVNATPTPLQANSWSDFSFDSYSTTDTDIESLHFASKRNINKDYSILIGKYYCFEPYFGIGMEIDGGDFAASDHDTAPAGAWKPNYAMGWHLPISSSKEISDGEIVPSGFFKKSDRLDNGDVSGFSNNTLGFYRLFETTQGGVGGKQHCLYDGLYSGVAKMNGATPATHTAGTKSAHTDVKEEDYTYDTTSTLQMGLRSILIELNTNVSEVRKYSDTASYFENRSGHTLDRYSSWFACPNLSAIYDQGHWYGVYKNGGTTASSGEAWQGTYHTPPISQSAISHYLASGQANQGNLDLDGTQIGYESLRGRTLHPHKHLCSIVRKVTPYGGWTKGSIEKTRYIPCGNFHPVGNVTEGFENEPKQGHVSQVFGGDTFVNLYSHQKTSTPYMKKSAARWQVFPVESYVNTDMRSGLNLNSGDTITGKEMNETPFSNDWLYNSVYSQENSIKSAVMMNEDESCESLDLPYEIAYSNTKILGQKSDSFRQFPINQFHDMEGLYGEINRIINFKNEIYVIQDSAFSKLLVNPLSMLSDDSGTSLFTGTGETVENHIYISTKYGTRHRFSVAMSEKSLYFVDSNFGRLFKYDTEKLISLGDALGQRNYLKYIIKEWEKRSYRVCPATSGSGAGVTHVSGNPVTHGTYKGDLDSMQKSDYSRNYFSDNPLSFLGITSIFDYKNKELLITFHNSSWYGSNTKRQIFARTEDNHSMGSTTHGEPVGISETLVYNEGVNAFIAKYSVAPPQWLSGGQGTFIVCPENEINVVSIANFNHTTGLSMIHNYYGSQFPYNMVGATSSQWYRNRRCNPLRLWLWDKHDEEKKTHFFGKKDDFIKNTSGLVSPLDASLTTSGHVVVHAGTKDVPNESYIVKVINSEAAYSKSFDNAQIVMTPSNVPFSDVNYLTDETNDVILAKSVLDNKTTRIDKEEELVINRRWDFDGTMDGWYFTDEVDGTNYPTPIIHLDSTISFTYTGNGRLRSPNKRDKINLPGKYNNIIRMRVKRQFEPSNWEGKLYWTGYDPKRKASGDFLRVYESDSRMVEISEPEGINNDFVIIEWDMSGSWGLSTNPVSSSSGTKNHSGPWGATDGAFWDDCIIEQIGIDLADTSINKFRVDWIEIGGLKADKYSDGVLKLPLRTEKSIRRTRGTWAKIKYTAKTTDKFNIFAILAKYRKIF